LTVVLGQAELLGRRLARDPNVRVDPASVDRIVREARRLRDLVTELLDVQRLEQGRIVGELVPLDLTDVVNTIRERHLAAGLALGVDEADAPIVVAMDRPRMEQLIENLIENAVKYGGEGGSPAIRLETVGGEAALSVVDHGVGIPEEERARVFERFYRASNAHGVTDTGMGLGLYICRRIVEEHGGRIRHEPTDGGGSTFIVTLPLVIVPQPVAVEPTPTSWSPAFEADAADA
jgi:signal transduction histidine kinase